MSTQLLPDGAALAPVDVGQIFELLPDAWLILDERRCVVTANDAYLRLMSCDLDALRGRFVHDINQFSSKEPRDEWRHWLDAVLLRLVPGQFELSQPLRYDIAPNGQLEAHYWRVRAAILQDGPHGRLYGLHVQDVTDNVEASARDQRERAKLRSQARLRQVLVEEANQQLRTQQERFQQALAFASVGAWELDTGAGTFVCTDQFKALLGLPPFATLTEARLFEESIDIEHRARVREALAHAAAGEAAVEVDFGVTWPNRRRRWILLRAGRGAAASEEESAGTSIVGLALDITTRKESELEHRAIADAEKKARQQSEEATRAMDHFVTTISHELRSPLGAIMSWATLLQRSVDAPHTARAGTVIERNARQLAHMVDDLLDSGAIATGKLSIEPVPVDLAALAGNVAEDMRMSFEDKGLKLVTDELESCVVMADENRMRQVIWNLLTNAAKFCAEGGVTVAVRAVGEQAEVSVSDTGCGIAPEALDRIFERFHQEGRSARASGLGLGLWLVRNIVTLHGGSIHAESEGRDRGATFRVRLPLYRR